jgi:ribosomal protein S18 acetylase RimI-like enzyme
MNDEIHYAKEASLTAEEFIDVLNRSTLAERRPVQDQDRIGKMLAQADLIITARNSAGLLVGISRTLTDFSFCAYLSDLAVDQAYQGRGIGRQLIDLTYQYAGPQVTLILLAAPAAETYYPHIGMTQFPSCWTIPRKQ